MTGLPAPTTVKDVRSFLRHAGFYRRLIKDFSKIARPLTAFLCKEVKLDFTPECLKAFEEIKTSLITAPIVQAPDWSLPFQIMCDASDFAVGAVLGQRKDKKLNAVYYASRTLMTHRETMQQRKTNYSPFFSHLKSFANTWLVQKLSSTRITLH